MAEIAPPPSLSEQIRDALVARIVSGALQPGDRLVELTLAREMGTSQAPVREALRALEGLGLIDFRRNRGAVVREITDEDLQEIYAVRAELEGLAAAETARRAPEVATDLLAFCTQMEAADAAAFVTLNTAFHRAILTASGNQTLLKIWEGLDVQMRTALNTARHPENLARAVMDHRKIADAIAAGDADAARAATRAHILGVV